MHVPNPPVLLLAATRKVSAGEFSATGPMQSNRLMRGKVCRYQPRVFLQSITPAEVAPLSSAPAATRLTRPGTSARRNAPTGAATSPNLWTEPHPLLSACVFPVRGVDARIWTTLLDLGVSDGPSKGAGPVERATHLLARLPTHGAGSSHLLDHHRGQQTASQTTRFLHFALRD